MSTKPKPEDIAGGQALIEGVMMRHGNKIAAAVRRPDKEIVFQQRDYIPLTKRYKILGWMFVRGTITLFEMMIIGIKCLMFSAEVALSEEEKNRQDGRCIFRLSSVSLLPFFSLSSYLHFFLLKLNLSFPI